VRPSVLQSAHGTLPDLMGHPASPTRLWTSRHHCPIQHAGHGDDTRACPWGATDRGGFPALGVTETLMHTFDITQGLGINWWSAESLCAAVLSRLVPDAPYGDPVQVLLWSTGRAELDDRPRVTPVGHELLSIDT